MKISQIPKHLLIHSIIYEEYIKVGIYDKEYKDPETFTNVLVQPAFKIIKDVRGQEREIKALIFLDTVNTPNCKAFVPDSVVKFGELEGIVVSCEPIYTIDPIKPHHYEVSLE